ncbi:BMA-LST-3, isoform h [Aphelenchoides fujianensis]|nr:BMA-LST-3, isoform h [Aphelenchoides fujianensis]
MSFNNGKPNAWNRPQQPQGQALNPNLFAPQLGLGQPFAPAGMPLNPNLNAFVNQAAFNNMNNAALVAAQAQRHLVPQNVGGPPRGNSPPGGRPNQRTFVGQVTKLCDTYGFIDEDVFFQTSVIKGAMPRVGDQVMVSATFNPSMPFKWNAFTVQMLDVGGQRPPPQIGQHAAAPMARQPQPYGHQQQPPAAPSGRWGAPHDRVERVVRDDIRDPRIAAAERHRPPIRRPSPRHNERRSPPRRSPPRRSHTPTRKGGNLPPRREPPPKRERERTPPSVRERESREVRRSPVPAKRDAESPPRRRQRIIPRYQCYLPRPLVSDSLTYLELHKRYPNLYIPSDFVRCEMSWKKSFNLEDPVLFAPHSVEFHVLHKDVDFPATHGELPPEQADDADPSYTVKVLLLTHPGAASIRQKVAGLLADGSIDEACEAQSLMKVLQFLIGMRGKGEVMGIGGQWSPSLDGANPADPQTLINTAVRTTRAMTGLDLSKCPKWYKMVDCRYFRVERDRWDHVVLLLPDISATPGLQPSAEEYRVLVDETLPAQLKEKLAAIDAEPFVPQSEAAKKVQAANEAQPDGTSGSAANEDAQPAADEAMDTSAGAEDASNTAEPPADDSEKLDNADAPNKLHWKQLETQIKSMKVADLRDQLQARDMSTNGLKNVLLARLHEALESEKKAEEGGADDSEGQLMVAEESAALEGAAADEKMDTEEALLSVKIEAVDGEEPKADEQKEEAPKELEKPAAPTLSREEKEEHKKEVDKFEKSKKDRKSAFERHYAAFPKSPCVFVFPNKTAKAGKFDWRVVSGQSLLDYRIDDNKEASFEVFLFAEALREALDRDAAFSLFHLLHGALEKEAEKKRRDEALTKVDEEPKEAADEEKKDENGADASTENPEGEPKDAPKDAREKSEAKSEAKDEKTPDVRLNFTAVVHDVNAFSAFSHFDQNVCGYLLDRDVEEIVHSLGLPISRSAVQRLLRKVSARDRFNYRNLTDKWVDKDGNVKYTPELDAQMPTRGQLLESNEDSPATPAAQSTGDTPDITNTGVVFFKGAVLNVVQSLEQHKLVEAERSEALLKVQQLEQQLKTTKEQRDHSDKKRKRLDEDLERYKKKLYDAEKCLKTSQDDTVQMKASLVEVKRYGERLVGIVDKLMPPPKKEERREKETSAKPDGKDAFTRSKSKEANGAKADEPTAPPAERADDQEAPAESPQKAAEAPAANDEQNGAVAQEVEQS